MPSPDISIVTSGHDVADARLHRQAAALIRAGLVVEVLGLGESSGAPPGASTRTWARRSGVRRAVRALRLPWLARAPVLITLDPDAAVGAWLRRALTAPVRRGRRIRLVADVHEDYRLLLRDRGWARGPRRLGGAMWARMGEVVARRADLTVVADPHLLVDAPRRVVLRNLPDPSMLPPPTPRQDVPRALYIGDLRRSRGLFAMLDAVEAVPQWHLDLVGPVALPDRAELERRLTRGGLGDRVHLHDRLPPQAAWEHARGAWVGMLLLEDTPAFRRAVPSKLYEYLACGLPVLATPLPRVRELLTRAGAGVLVTGVDEAAGWLRRWADTPTALDELRAAALAASTLPSDADGFVDGCVRLCHAVGARRAAGSAN